MTLCSLLSTLLTSSTYAADERKDPEKSIHASANVRGLEALDRDMEHRVVQCAAFNQALCNESPVNLATVCKAWEKIIKQSFAKDKACWKAWHGIVGNEEAYERFKKGVLVYRPQEGSDTGRIDMPIAALGNPLEGMFDLSGCGNVSQHLSISTGYRKGKKAGNIAEIWFVPRFLIEKKLKTTTSHFQQIFDGWKEDTAPVGIFFTHASWEDLTAYFYLTTKNLDFISHNNLYQLRNDHIMTMELRGIHGMDNFARYAEVVLKKFTFML